VARAAKYQREVRVYMDPPAPEKNKETDQDSGRFFYYFAEVGSIT